MSEGSIFRRLHGSAVRVQVTIVLAVIPIAALLYGVVATPVVVDVAMAGAPEHAQHAARASTRLAVGIVVLVVSLATIGASLLLRGSLRSVVEQLQTATMAVARGDFAHRVGSRRSDELGELARSIDTMAGRLERLEQSRRRMLACVSHELRTPLTIIQGHAFTLARREPDPVRRDRLELVQAEAARLAELIEDLVDASCLHAGSVRLRVERHDLAEIVRATARRFHEEAGVRGVQLVVAGDERAVPVDVDAARIDQLLANVLANAVRHADAGTRIVVTLSPGRGSNARAVIVENRGPAIPPAVASRIFEPFVQGNDRTGRVGLGLAIAHDLAAAHGGRLVLASRGEQDGVVRFRLELPAPCRSSSPRAEVERAPVRRATSRLRLVET